MDQARRPGRAARIEGLFQSVQHEVRAGRRRHPPAHDAASEDIDDESHVDEALPGRHVGVVNGLITNDKFCVSRQVHLQLTWSRYEVWRQRTVTLKTSPSAEMDSRGGCHETAMADSPADDRITGRPAAMGSGVPMAAGVEPAHDGPDRFTTEGGP
jgi:hypothetical protein